MTPTEADAGVSDSRACRAVLQASPGPRNTALQGTAVMGEAESGSAILRPRDDPGENILPAVRVRFVLRVKNLMRRRSGAASVLPLEEEEVVVVAGSAQLDLRVECQGRTTECANDA
jgi:hypothetical protein